MIDLDKPVHVTYVTQNDPFGLNCALFEGYGLDGVTVDSL